MSQQLLTEQKITFTKPSDLLRLAHYVGIRQIKYAFRENNGFCARGVIQKFAGESRGWKLIEDKNYMLFDNNFSVDEYDLFSNYKYGKDSKELSDTDYYALADVLGQLSSFNDSPNNPNFLECAEFLEKLGY